MTRRRHLLPGLLALVLLSGGASVAPGLGSDLVDAAATGLSAEESDVDLQPLVSLTTLLPEMEGPRHVFEIQGDPAAGDGLLIVGSHGAAWVDADGRPVRRVVFEGGVSHFPVRAVPLGDGETGFLGLRNRSFGSGRSEGDLILYGPDGRVRARFPAGYSSEFFVADLLGDAAPEVLVETPRGRGLVIYALDGRRLRSYDAGAYISGLAPVDVDRDPRAEIALYLYPVEGRGAFQILDPEGGLHASWPAPAVGGFDVVELADGGPGFLILVDDGLEIEAVGGRVVETLEAPGAGRFRTAESRVLPDGRRFTLASGAGDLDSHMIVIHGAPNGSPDGGSRLLYRRVDSGRARALHSAPAAGGNVVIYLGIEDTVWTLHLGHRDGATDSRETDPRSRRTNQEGVLPTSLGALPPARVRAIYLRRGAPLHRAESSTSPLGGVQRSGRPTS